MVYSFPGVVALLGLESGMSIGGVLFALNYLAALTNYFLAQRNLGLTEQN